MKQQTTQTAQRRLRASSSAKKARILRSFFKTGPGQYGEGDVFIGVTVPVIRRVARAHRDISLVALRPLLRSRIHEERLLGLIILTEKYKTSDTKDKAKVYRTYLSHVRWINNWDLVDVTAPHVVGAHLYHDRASISLLDRFALSPNLWRRRIAIVSTHCFIRNGNHEHTLRIAKTLLRDPHDLIHKAVGWMLREVGKRDVAAMTRFLDKHADQMPRTMLRYAIERLPEKSRQHYLAQGRGGG